MSGNESMIFSLYGALSEDAEGGFSLKTLCAMLARLGLSAEASRLALSRMARRGFLYTKRRGKASFYFLSAAGAAIIDRAEKGSVCRDGAPAWDGRFRLVSYELPESLREERAALAEALRQGGFGRAAAGLWAGPFEPGAALRERLSSPGLRGLIEEYEAVLRGDARAFARRIFRLDERRRTLDAFLARFSADREAFLVRRASGRGTPDADCFTAYFQALDAYVDAMASVPPLPPELLPQAWPAEAARELFVSYRGLVRDGAGAFYESVYEPFEPADAARTKGPWPPQGGPAN